jgi:hypothetical protein
MIGVFFPVVGISQSASYKENLKKNIALFESAKTANDFIYAANCFEKLAVTEKNQWLPFYYAGLCDALAAFEKQNKDIDTYCDKADVFARKADSLSKNNSEISVLKSMIAAARIHFSKAQRGQKFGLMAAFGGGEKKSKPIFESVLEKLKTYKSDSNLYPSWGREEAEKELKKINLSTKK